MDGSETTRAPHPCVPVPAERLAFRSYDDGSEIVDADSSTVLSEASTLLTDCEERIRVAYTNGRQHGEEAAIARIDDQMASQRSLIAVAIASFEGERKRYFVDVEKEVVRLALAIAERVLHREANMDPMLLAGAARVALEQVVDSSDTILRVSAEDVDRWSETLRSTAPRTVTIESDPELARGECVLKTRSGSVQLGLRAQLQEIERGFFELLEQRPALPV